MAAYIDHAAYYVRDLASTAEIFQKAFGMTVTRIRENPDGRRELWLSGGVQLCEKPDFTQDDGRCAHLSLLVEDLEQARSAALAAGCTPLPKHHWVRLPDGLQLELFAAKSGVIQNLMHMEMR